MAEEIVVVSKSDTNKATWYRFPYILGLLPIVVPVLAFLFILARNNAIAQMQNVVRREVSQSLSVTHSTVFTGSIIPGDRYRDGVVVGKIQTEQNRQDVRSRGVFTDCSSDCAEVSPSDERVTKYDRSGILRTFLAEYHNTPTSEQARLVWSATHEQARCHVKHTFEARRVLNSYHIACLSMSSGAYVYAFQAN